MPLHRLEFVLHILPELRVKRGERLVEKEHLRVVDCGARNGDTLLLTARELLDRPLFEALQVHELDHLRDAALDLILRNLRDLEAEGDVVVNVIIRKKCVTLENSVDIPLVSGNVFDVDSVKNNLAGIRFKEPGNEPQGRRFSAAGRAQQRDEFLVLDGKAQIVKNNIIVKFDGDIAKLDNVRRISLIHFLHPPLR